MITTKNKQTLSPIVISTALGHSCGGLFPYTHNKQYQLLMEIISQTNTVVFSKSSTPQGHHGRVVLFNPHKPWTLFPFLYTASKYIKKYPTKKW